MGNTYFEHKSLRKHAMLARGQDGVEVMSKIDLVLVKEDMLRRGCVDQIFTPKHIGEKEREKQQRVYVGFICIMV